jgi:hypothetical protein
MKLFLFLNVLFFVHTEVFCDIEYTNFELNKYLFDGDEYESDENLDANFQSKQKMIRWIMFKNSF